MSADQFKAFMDSLEADSELQKIVGSVSTIGELLELAKSAGFILSAEDINGEALDLSDHELESVSGGAWSPYRWFSVNRECDSAVCITHNNCFGTADERSCYNDK